MFGGGHGGGDHTAKLRLANEGAASGPVIARPGIRVAAGFP